MLWQSPAIVGCKSVSLAADLKHFVTVWPIVGVQIVGIGAKDSSPEVRGQAMFALGELAGNCQPEMSAHAREALPYVFAAMAEANPTLQQQACYALDSFCEHLGMSLILSSSFSLPLVLHHCGTLLHSLPRSQ